MVKKMMTNVFAVFVIFIVLAIIIPLPTPILDFLLIINIMEAKYPVITCFLSQSVGIMQK